MKIFVSWSGELSHKVASILSSWLPTVLHGAQIWEASTSIEKGSQFMNEISNALKTSDCGIFCVTPDNFLGPWLNYEAGALWAGGEGNRVYPFLLGLTPKHLGDYPLSKFQCTSFSESQVKLLVGNLASHEAGPKKPATGMSEEFDRAWMSLQEQLEPLIPVAAGLSTGIVKYLKGRKHIYDHALEILQYAEHTVRVLQFYGGPRPPVDFAREVAKVLAYKKGLGIDVTYEVYLAADRSTLPPELANANKQRFKIYHEAGVGDRVKVSLVNMKYPPNYRLDVFLVDRKHGHISFPTSDKEGHLQRGIAFEGQEQVVGDLVEWFQRAVTSEDTQQFDWANSD